MSDLTRHLRMAEDSLTSAIVDERMDGTPDIRLSGLREPILRTIIGLREIAGMIEHWENAEAVNGNVGHYAGTDDLSQLDDQPWND
jgi:hypothetical protein